MKVVVLSPHPDDAEIGCGGTLRKHVLAGDHVRVIYMTNGELAGTGRVQEAALACDILGIPLTQVSYMSLPDGGGAGWDVPRAWRSIIGEPDILYAPHMYEAHVDHYAAYTYATTIPAEEYRFYEVWTPLRKPDLLVDITCEVAYKRAAILAHKSQAHNSFAEAILALNHYRGLMHDPQKMYVEAFSVLDARPY